MIKWFVLFIVLIFFIPFYTYIISKSVTLGKINVLKHFFYRERGNVKDKPKNPKGGNK